ncbi:MAG: ABC-2 family transporter protein [Actinomycetota bacterium]
MIANVRAAMVTWRSAWREASSNRAGFWTQVVIMLANDVVWIVFWGLLFNRVDNIRGWDFDRMVLLFTVFTISGGIVLGLLNNVRRLGELATTGGLDAALALPTSTLLHVVVRRIEPINLGDIVFGIVLFLTLGDPTLAKAGLVVFGVVCSASVWSGFLILVGSFGFFVGRREPGELGFSAMAMFSNYPIDLYAGGLRVLLYGVVPAAFVTSVPAKIVDDFSLTQAALLGGVAVLMMAIGVVAFNAGLRRYTSGAVWTSA